jgi:hypothetical protein
LFDFSRLLDLYAFLQLPLYVTIVAPSAAGADPKAAQGVPVESGQWPSAPSEESQRQLAASWVALAVAKPFVRSVCWKQASDSVPHVYPHGGLFRPDGTPKSAFGWLKDFRREYLG